MIRYRLPEGISIMNSVEYKGMETFPEYINGRYIIVDKINEREYLINETIKYFIEKFSTPKTKNEILAEVALDIDADIKKIEKRCSSFIKYLYKRKIITTEDDRKNIQIKGAVFQAGDWINDLYVLEVVANKHYTDLYHVLDKKHDKHYIVKLLNPQKLADDVVYREELADMEHEYRMLHRIKDIPSVCHVIGFNKQYEKGAYIVMEYIEGNPLSQYLSQTGALSFTDTIQIMKNILAAFALIHESGLVHGDIHPSNIMVREDKTVKIIDLGLSFDTHIAKDEIQRIGGVNYYMPPERINVSSVEKFSKEADFYSDVYQIGLIIYYILYRKEPFEGFIWEELAKNIKSQKISCPSVSYHQFAIPAKMIEIIEKCTRKYPRKRYANAASLYEDFRKKFPENFAS